MSSHDNPLNMIKEGMKVFDNTGEEVGTVEWVHFGEAEGSPSSGAASLSTEPVQPDLVEFLGKAFGSDKLPDELRERLLMHGFIKIDSKKLFGADRYVMFDQIDRIEKGKVYLKVADSEGLLKG